MVSNQKENISGWKTYPKSNGYLGNPLVVQWSGLWAFTAEGPGSITGRGTKIPQASWLGHKNKEMNILGDYWYHFISIIKIYLNLETPLWSIPQKPKFFTIVFIIIQSDFQWLSVHYYKAKDVWSQTPEIKSVCWGWRWEWGCVCLLGVCVCVLTHSVVSNYGCVCVFTHSVVSNYGCVCACVCVCARARLLTQLGPWAVARQVPLFMGFFRQEYWRELPFSSSRGSSQSRDWTRVSSVSCTAGRFFTRWAIYNLRQITKPLTGLRPVSQLSNPDDDTTVLPHRFWDLKSLKKVINYHFKTLLRPVSNPEK